MRTVLLAGGLGTRLAEETGDRPKPMVEIGGSSMAKRGCVSTRFFPRR
jgi:glucose-1-phosphate cytidylyltransferase